MTKSLPHQIVKKWKQTKHFKRYWGLSFFMLIFSFFMSVLFFNVSFYNLEKTLLCNSSIPAEGVIVGVSHGTHYRVLGNIEYDIAHIGYEVDNKVYECREYYGSSGLDPAQVKVLDATFGGQGLPCAGCRFDVELNAVNVGDLKYIEYKSLQDASKITLDQFKNYLYKVSDLNELNYVFNKAKLPLDDAKKGMASVFKNNAGDLWDLNEGLFKNRKITLDEKLLEIKSKEEFIEVTNHKDFVDSDFLNFVKSVD